NNDELIRTIIDYKTGKYITKKVPASILTKDSQLILYKEYKQELTEDKQFEQNVLVRELKICNSFNAKKNYGIVKICRIYDGFEKKYKYIVSDFNTVF